MSPGQKEVSSSHKLQDHAYEQGNPFKFNEDNLSQIYYWSTESS